VGTPGSPLASLTDSSNNHAFAALVKLLPVSLVAHYNLCVTMQK